MPFANIDQARIFWRVDGHADRPALVLLNSIGTDLAMWAPVMADLLTQFQVVRLDIRGHGASSGPPADYSMAMLGHDVITVMDAAGIQQAAICGLSLGGMVAQRLCLNASGRFWAAVVANTSSDVPSDAWAQRADLVREKGMSAIVDIVMGRIFSTEFQASGSPAISTIRQAMLAVDPQAYAGCCAAIRDLALRHAIGAIRIPLLAIGGSRDVALPLVHARTIAEKVAKGTYQELDAGHLSCIEQPQAFAAATIAFLQLHLPTRSTLEAAREVLFANGLGPRKAVLGEEWVHRGLLSRSQFSGEFQEFITRYAWGEIWGRPGLDHRTRRLLVLATTIALGRWEEFRLHVRAGIEQEGFSIDDLREVIMQAGVYAGVPAANTGFHHAEDVLKALGKFS